MNFVLCFVRTCWCFKSDAAIVGRQWGHEFTNGIHQLLDLDVVAFEPPFDLGELGDNLLIRGQRLTHSHESAHHEDTHFDGALGVQHSGRHDGAVFGKCVRQVTTPAMAGT